MKSYASKFAEGKKFSQDNLIPIVILVVGGNGGKAPKQYVQDKIYEIFREEFKNNIYHEKVANATVERWKHDIAWARERAKQQHGYIKSAKESGRGTWELTASGRAYFDQLTMDFRQMLSDQADSTN
jgi:hypothetical protein